VLLDFRKSRAHKARPMSVKVKICGINSAEVADAAVLAGADFAGLNLHTASPRRLSVEQARALADRLRSRLRVVVLLCDAADESIEQAVRSVRPDFLQLHGAESPERTAQIRERFRLDVIKAIAVQDETDLDTARAFEAVADMLLFDAKAPASAARSGGHGIPFDWRLLRGRNFARPWLLAGGLDPENVARAIAVSGAPGVDVSSGVETAPGRKSAKLVREFVSRAKATTFASGESR
jgi:phosphoribosylanthranilate isomerase